LPEFCISGEVGYEENGEGSSTLEFETKGSWGGHRLRKVVGTRVRAMEGTGRLGWNQVIV